jgi:hypothetical protein
MFWSQCVIKYLNLLSDFIDFEKIDLEVSFCDGDCKSMTYSIHNGSKTTTENNLALVELLWHLLTNVAMRSLSDLVGRELST